MVEATPRDVQIFYAYTQRDGIIRGELEECFSSLQRQGYLSQWHSRMLRPGADWSHDIHPHLTRASFILFLVSPEFIASDYCYGAEMRAALQRQVEGEASIVPILLRPVEWQDSSIGHLQALPANGRPITAWADRKLALLEVMKGLRSKLERGQGLQTSDTPFPEQPWTVPYQRNPFFIGQDETLARLRQSLQRDQRALLSDAQAMGTAGGSGKTQVAAEYAFRYRSDYSAVLWVRADRQAALALDFAMLARTLRLPEHDATDQRVCIEAVKRWLVTHDRWLLVFENVADMALLSDFLPNTDCGHLLLTSRVPLQDSDIERVDVEVPTEMDGAYLLLRQTGMLAPDSEPPAMDEGADPTMEGAQELAHTLAGLPLAIALAGAYMQQTGCERADYIRSYQGQLSNVVKRRNKLVRDCPEAVVTAWALSLEWIEHIHPAAIELLYLCAFLYASGIPEECIRACASDASPTLHTLAADPLILDETLEMLRAYALIERDAQRGEITIHPLAQSILRDRLSKKQQRQWVERIVQALSRIFPEPETSAVWSLCQRYVLNAIICAEWLDYWHIVSGEAALLLSRAGSYLKERAHYADATTLLYSALHMHEQLLGFDHLDVAFDLSELTDLSHCQGHYDQSIALCSRALTIYEQAQGPLHPDVARCLNDLAGLYVDQGQYELAVPLYQRALSIATYALGQGHVDVALLLNNLAMLYSEQGQYELAVQHYEGALAISVQALGADHLTVATMLSNLAALHYTKERYAEALSLYRRALPVYEQQLGPQHSRVALLLNNLAELCSQQGEQEEAVRLYERALSIQEQVLGPDHPKMASGLNNLALLFERQGRREEAVQLLERAIAAKERVFGPDHPDGALGLNNLALLYEKEGREEEALQLMQRALTIYERMRTARPLDEALCVANLALLYERRGQYDRATSLTKRALIGYEQELGFDHPRTAALRERLAVLKQAQSERQDAVEVVRDRVVSYFNGDARTAER